MELSCYWCGSARLAWSEEGYIVCQSCGSIVSESSIDERLPTWQRRRAGQGVARRASGRLRTRRIVEKLVKRAGRSLGVALGSPRRLLLATMVNRKAESLLQSSDRLSFIASLVDSDPVLKARSLRTRVALAVYLDLRSRGYGKRYSIERASILAGSSRSTLERTISKYRDRIEILQRRILG